MALGNCKNQVQDPNDPKKWGPCGKPIYGYVMVSPKSPGERGAEICPSCRIKRARADKKKEGRMSILYPDRGYKRKRK